MAIASILILGLVSLAAGDAKGSTSDPAAVPAPDLHAVPSLGSWAAHPQPRGTRRALLFLQEDEEDDTSEDDGQRDSALAFVASRPGTSSGDLLALRGTGRILSRSASPTLRLRC
jgi:hypothetical protein